MSDFRIVFNHKIVDYKILSFHSVFAHIELEKFLDSILSFEFHSVKTHVWTDEFSELRIIYLSETFESGYFRVVAESGNRGFPLFIGIAIERIFLSLL